MIFFQAKGNIGLPGISIKGVKGKTGPRGLKLFT